MLEGLAKSSGGLHDRETFCKIEEYFELLEDTFGAIDYYDAFAQEFAAIKKGEAE